jgi:tetratricopeptide (TPR) repeat protein
MSARVFWLKLRWTFIISLLFSAQWLTPVCFAKADEIACTNWESNPTRCQFAGGWYKGGHPKECALLRKLLNTKRFTHLLRASSSLSDREPKSLDYLFFKAQAYSKLGEKRSARLLCNKILSADSRNGSTLILRQHCNYELRDLPEALADSNRIIALAPDSAVGYWLRSFVYLSENKPERAMPDCNKAVAIGHKWVHYFNRGAAHIQLGDYKSAVGDYTLAHQANAKFHMILFMRGIGYRNIGEYRKAITDFTTALELKPDFWKLYQLRGSTFQMMGQKEKACADFEQATLHEPNYARNYFTLGTNATEAKESRRALTQEDVIDSKVERGSEYLRKGRYDQALTQFNGILSRKRNHLDALIMRAQTYRKLKKFDEALQDLQKVEGWESQSGDIAAQLKALIYFDRCSYVQALSAANAALFFEPSWYEAYYLKAVSLDALKRNDAALSAYRKFVEAATTQRGESRAALYFTDKAQLENAVKLARARIAA